MSRGPTAFSLARFRERLTAAGTQRTWSGIDELLDDQEFVRWLQAEFPDAAHIGSDTGRRTFLKLMGGSLLMAGLTACGAARSDQAIPYVDQPENMVPGVPRLYATAVEFDGYAQPVLATCHDGRPIKLDGNPQHPATRGGGSDVFTQAAVLQLYDPDRSKAPLRDGQPATWAAFEAELAAWRRAWTQNRGRGIRLLTGPLSSPTLLRQLGELLGGLPEARWHVLPATGAGWRDSALLQAAGQHTDMHYALEGCDVIVSLDDDLLGPGANQIRYARAWASRRGEIDAGKRTPLHIAECTPSLTGVVASTRLAVDADRLSLVARAFAESFGLAGEGGSTELTSQEATWVANRTRELQANKGRSLFTCGCFTTPAMQAIALGINQALGNLGTTVNFTEPITSRAIAGGTLTDLVRDIDSGLVDTLIILDANPAYAAPTALHFDAALKQVRTRVHAGLYQDETAALCNWHLPLSHALESWGDARAVDGTASIMQPLVGPLYSARTMPQLLAMLTGEVDPAADTPVRKTWSAIFKDDFTRRWQQALHDGFVDGTAAAAQQRAITTTNSAHVQGAQVTDDAVDVLFRPDPCVWDGRFANIAWLQELPKPLSKIVWDCPIAVSARLADGLRLANGDLVEVTVGDEKITGPACITPGQAPRTIVLYLGYGRRLGGKLAAGLGYPAYAVMPADGAWQSPGAIRRVAGSRQLVTTQLHHRMEGFEFVREVSAASPSLPPPKPQASLYPQVQAGGDYAWAMVIDLDRCIGCNACIAACNVENNVLVVGKDQVAMGREMLWLRVDHYYTGDIEDPRASFQPVPCMHCEKAPCEMGCPVHATVHSAEGVNQMVYNRCIGTRTCSSYCPYKVRRFNWYDYRRFDEPSIAAHNPDVTVRSRGVMEKCTYCTQRVQAAHASADKEGRAIREGEVVTACQQACPATAISFGNLKDAGSSVAKLRDSQRHYALLEELGTRPRTTYLARWRDAGGGER